jgi:hypothetical protein
VLLGAGASLGRKETPALFTIAAVSLLLVFIGIHNAWDAVTYITLTRDDLKTRDAAASGDALRQPADPASSAGAD